ncbi:hypothetical protein B0H13DRAFT_2689976 [Mycena leptocephala]|nr:hypothetical protein B0H13DRAFT_2689976 [Mycena leptocephala]
MDGDSFQQATDETTGTGIHLGLTRADGLWFQDCGLIIQAETTLFRVSRDFLAMRSPVFRDMLSMPTPKDAEMMGGCPFVCLPDSAEDITYFLKALLYYEFFEPFPAVTTFPILAGVLRMSHKYEVDELRKRALVHLSSCHPTRLEDRKSMNTTSSWSPKTTSHYLQVIILARQMDALWILPTAFYQLCDKEMIEDIFAGTPGCSLSSADLLTYVTGLRFLETTGLSAILEFMCVRTIDGCLHPQECSEARVVKRFEAENWRKYERALFRPYLPFDIWTADDWGELGVCSVCLARMMSLHQAAAELVWSRLPETFQLPPWEELEQMKTEALE